MKHRKTVRYAQPSKSVHCNVRWITRVMFGAFGGCLPKTAAWGQELT
jgi:hypothetical protein